MRQANLVALNQSEFIWQVAKEVSSRNTNRNKNEFEEVDLVYECFEQVFAMYLENS